MMGGGLYNMALHGTGWVAILSDGPPVLLNVAAAPTFADAQAAITWSSGVTTGIRTDFKMKNLIGRGSGETIQMSFQGQGWVLVQPSEGRITPVAAATRRAAAAALGSLLERLTLQLREALRLDWVIDAGSRLPSLSHRRDRLRQVDAADRP